MKQAELYKICKSFARAHVRRGNTINLTYPDGRHYMSPSVTATKFSHSLAAILRIITDAPSGYRKSGFSNTASESVLESIEIKNLQILLSAEILEVYIALSRLVLLH